MPIFDMNYESVGYRFFTILGARRVGLVGMSDHKEGVYTFSSTC